MTPYRFAHDEIRAAAYSEIIYNYMFLKYFYK